MENEVKNIDNHRRLKLIRHNIEQKEKRGEKFYISIYAVFDNGNEMPVVEKVSSLDEYDEAIQLALDENPNELIIVRTDAKKTPRLKKNETRISLVAQNEKPEFTQKLMSEFEQRMAKLKEELHSDNGDGEGLGVIRKEYEHQTELMKREMTEKFKQIEFERKIEKLERQLAEKEEELAENDERYQELENEFKELENEFEKYKKDKFAGLSEQLAAAGQNALAGIVQKAIPLLTGGKGVAGLPGILQKQPAQASSTTIIEETEENENKKIIELANQIKSMLQNFNDEQYMKFYELMTIIATDYNNLDVIMKILKPEKSE